MINKILSSIDKNTAAENFCVLVTMLDASQAFERQSHILGIQSFIDNKIRVSLIPTLIIFFKDRKLRVKWNSALSQTLKVTGGGGQGVTSGILEYLSITKGNLDFIPEDEAFKFIDDTSFLEVLNLLQIGLSSLNTKMQVPSDISPEDYYLPPQNFETPNHLDRISNWTSEHQMLLNAKKSKYMIINFCKSLNFKTRLYVNNSLIEQVRQTRLLGVVISDDLSWNSNTDELTKKAYKRMIILRKLNEFKINKYDMIKIYILFIISAVEQSSAVWSSSITQDELN